LRSAAYDIGRIEIFVVGATCEPQLLEQIEGDERLVIVAAVSADAVLGSPYFEVPRGIVILGSDLSANDQTKIVEKILAGDTSAKILVLVAPEVGDVWCRAWQAGARGVLCDELLGDGLFIALQHVMSGQRYICPQIGARLADRLLGRLLSPREQDVLVLLASGKSNRAIATELEVREGTVRSHVSSLMGKLGVSNRTEAAALAIKRGLLLSSQKPSAP
jgi:DNA-binding NarL/FixJ family response regulator